MIENWQYVALGIIVATVIAVLQYRTWRANIREGAFFSTLEAAVSSALAARQFGLASKTHTPKSFGHRTWWFERPSCAILLYWDGRDREIGVELQDRTSPTRSRERLAVFGIAPASSPDCYQRAIDGILGALNTAVAADA